MSISGVELRRQMFAKAGPADRSRQGYHRSRTGRTVRRPARYLPPLPDADLSAGADRARAISDQAVRNVARKISDASTQAAHATGSAATGNQRIVETACGLSLLLYVATYLLPAIAPALASTSIGSAFLVLAGATAYPALMFTTGMLAAPSIANGWGRFFERAILPIALASLLWTAFIAVHVYALTGDSAAIAPGMLLLAIAERSAPVSLLALLPVFLLLAKLARTLPVAAVLVVAAGLEIFAAGRSDMIAIMAARGLVYFLAGCLLARDWRQLCDHLRGDRQLALHMLGIWALLAGLLLLAPLPQAGGRTAGSLPFATLAIGMSGSLALLIAAMLLQHSAAWLRPLAALPATAGRYWLAAYVAVAALAVSLAATDMDAPLLVAHTALCIAMLMLVSAAGQLAAGARADTGATGPHEPWQHPQARERLVLHLKGL